jgi:hypothetical protein
MNLSHLARRRAPYSVRVGSRSFADHNTSSSMTKAHLAERAGYYEADS